MNNHASLQYQALHEHAAIVFPEGSLQQKLSLATRENKKLTVKLGFDPTAPDLHLGHAVVLRKLKQFQDHGHAIVIVIGDFTARIGDPTGKNKARPTLSEEQVQENARTYIGQVSKVLDVGRCKMVFNATWLSVMNASEMIRFLSHYTVAQVMQRTDFQKRFQDGTAIALHELVYPLLQGYDSVEIAADIEIGGTDQLFNCTVGRQLQESFGHPPQTVICMPLLRGTDGSAKMSKSERNTIGLTDEPGDMFGKIMSLPDDLLEDYLMLASGFDAEEIAARMQQLKTGVNPMLIKKELGHNIVSLYHSVEAADKAQHLFEKQFQNRNTDEKEYMAVNREDIGLLNEAPLLDLCSKLKPEKADHHSDG